MAQELSTTVTTLTGFTPVLVFEGAGKVLIKVNGAPCWFGDSTIDQNGGGEASSSFNELVGAQSQPIAEFAFPTKVFACRKAGEAAPTVKVRNWY